MHAAGRWQLEQAETDVFTSPGHLGVEWIWCSTSAETSFDVAEAKAPAEAQPAFPSIKSPVGTGPDELRVKTDQDA